MIRHALPFKTVTFFMRKNLRHTFTLLLGILLLGIGSSCSTQKNTKASRWWHSFNARYNTYYNGSVAYIEASEQKEKGNKDNYTEFLPLYTIGNKESRKIGEAQYETAITKAKKAIKQHSIKQKPEWTKSRRKTERDIEWLNRREYNPFLWKAWMLMGRSQFYKGSFDEAAATFSYMSRLYRTQPAIYGKARAWLAKCYIEQEWLYDAEDVIRNMHRDSIDWRARKEWDYTLADYYLHTGDMDKAVDYLRKVISHERRKVQKAREYFLLGQILAAQGHDAEAYKAYRKVIRQNPPYELEFNARIAMTEVMSGQQAKSKIRRLKRMARSDKNIEYLDQVYYAIGNIYLAEGDTMKAIYAYEEGNGKSKRQSVEKGVLLLHLGNLYWAKERFGDARRCYGSAIGLLDKDRKDYAELDHRSKVLDELAPHTDAIHLQDSLQALAKMDEKSRNEAIDRVIEALKKKEKEEKLQQLENEAQKNAQNAGNVPQKNTAATTPPPSNRGDATWYFYNPIAVQQGKQTFQKLWGKRENADDWQRNNKTVVASLSADDTSEGADNEEVADSLSTSTEEAPADSASLDPHKREYYLAQIPFTPEQVEASNSILSQSLFSAGKIFMDKLDNLALCRKHLLRLNNDFPDFKQNDEVFYYLFLLYSREGDKERAANYKAKLQQDYADNALTRIISDPYFEENARYGTHREDSLYADTYNAFRDDVYDTVERNGRISEERYPDGGHRDKFLFISGLARLSRGDADSCVAAMERVVKEFPKSDVSAIAGMIINGVKSGRQLKATRFDISDIWNYRTETSGAENDSTTYAFSDNADEEHVFLLTYHPDSLVAKGKGTPEHLLLYEMARHNFTSYLVRNFDMGIEEFQGMHRIVVSGFHNHDEALTYARSLYGNTAVTTLAHGSRGIVISRKNLDILGRHLSYNDYEEFYEKHYADEEKLFGNNILNEMEISPELYDPEMRPSEKNDEENEGKKPAETSSGDTFEILDNNADTSGDDSGIIIPETETEKQADSEIIIPEVETEKNADSGIIIPEEDTEKKQIPKVVKPEKKTAETSQKKVAATRQEINSDIIEIIDPEAGQKTSGKSQKTNAGNGKKAEKKEDKQTGKKDDNSAVKKDNKSAGEKTDVDDDEYFDFDGF